MLLKKMDFSGGISDFQILLLLSDFVYYVNARSISMKYIRVLKVIQKAISSQKINMTSYGLWLGPPLFCLMISVNEKIR